MASQQQSSEIKQIAKGIRAFADMKLERPEWGAINFIESKSVLESLIVVSRILEEGDLTIVSDDVANRALSHFRGIIGDLQMIQNFRIDTGSAMQVRETIKNNLSSRFGNFLSDMGASLFVLNATRTIDDKIVKELTEARIKWEELVSVSTKRAEKLQKEMEDVLSAMRNASPSIAIGTYSSAFTEMVTDYEKRADKWLFSSAAAFALTVFSSWYFWHYTDAGLDQGQVVQKLTTKLFVLASLVTATLWCGRNFKAMKHLAVTYKHRELSFRTFQAFRSGSDDEQTRNAVLLEATRSVFGALPTGFVEDQANENDLKVIEIARSVMPEK